jgi:two-component system sensor histidine kinase YesM
MWRNKWYLRWLYWPDWRMEAKLCSVFLVLLIIPIGVVTQLSAERYSRSIETNTVSYTSQIADKVLDKLDDYIEDMKKISIIPSYLDAIQSGLRKSNEFYATQDQPLPGKVLDPRPAGVALTELERRRLDMQVQIENSIYFITNLKTGTNTVYLFDLHGNPYFVMKSSVIRSDLTNVYPEWKQMADSANGAPVLTSTQEVSDAVNRKRIVFTVVRQIIDTSFSPLGMIAIDANISVIENIVKDLDLTTHGTTLILDEQNRVIYDSQKQHLPQNLGGPKGWSQEELGSEGSLHTTVNGQEELIIFRKSEQTGWRIFISIPRKQLMADADRIRSYTFFAGTGFVLFAMLISIILIYALNRPLRSLVDKMKEVQRGNLNVSFPVRRRDEAGLVGMAFNRMIQRVSQLIDEIHGMEQRKKKVELDSLQHQINPHFIYNTLESIRMTAVLHDDSEVADMSRLLGKLLRYSIHQSMETVPVTQEWEHLEMYVGLLNYRYGNRFDLNLPAGDLSRVRVIKLIFQPIVENSINHGQGNPTTRMAIVIGYRREADDIVFTITDNGVGMSEETLEELRVSVNGVVAEADGKRKGIGFRNVHERIRLRYGSRYGLSIDSAPGQGTKVTIRLPYEEANS